MTDDLKREVREISSHSEWLGWREKDLTCSEDIPSLLGVNPYGDAARVTARKRGVPETPTIAQIRSRRRGLLMEHLFPAAIAEEHPDWEITKTNTYHRLPELRIGCSTDFRKNPGRVIVETKTINETRWQENHCQPLMTWKVQVHGQMLVTDAPSAVIAVIVANADLPLYLFEIERDRFIEAEIMAAATDFWAKFDNNEHPVAVPSNIAAMLDDGSHIDLSGHNQLPEWLEERELLKAENAQAERRIKELDYEIKTRMGKASTGWLPGWKISWKKVHYKEYTVPAQDRRSLSVKRTKEMDNDES